MVPDQISLEAASTVGMCGLTAARAFFSRLDFPCPFSVRSTEFLDMSAGEMSNVIMYGASTSLGLYIAQLIRLSARTFNMKIRLIGVASRRNHKLLAGKPYEYDVLLDYRDAKWPEKAMMATENIGSHCGVDAISEKETV